MEVWLGVIWCFGLKLPSWWPCGTAVRPLVMTLRGGLEHCLLNSLQSTVLLLCAHAQGVHLPLRIVPRPHPLCRSISIDSHSRARALGRKSHRDKIHPYILFIETCFLKMSCKMQLVYPYWLLFVYFSSSHPYLLVQFFYTYKYTFLWLSV